MTADNFAVAGIEIRTLGGNLLHPKKDIAITSPDFTATGWTSGRITRSVNVDFAIAYPLDDDILHGDANVDGIVNMGDVTAVERSILGLQATNINADANGDGKINMADVIKIERTILGLP